MARRFAIGGNTAQHARRDTRFAGITTGTARDDTTIAAAGSWERRLTQVISSATTLSYSDTRSEQDGSASGDARTWTARVGLSWDINETLRAGAGIAHLRRDVSGPRFQPSEVHSGLPSCCQIVSERSDEERELKFVRAQARSHG